MHGNSTLSGGYYSGSPYPGLQQRNHSQYHLQQQLQNPADSRAQRYGNRLHHLTVLPGPRLYQPAEIAAVNPSANPYHHGGREAHIAAEDKRHDWYLLDEDQVDRDLRSAVSKPYPGKSFYAIPA